ncbi:MAG: methyltransferase domain-containing protein [Methanomicrobiales archaeon]|nr:methyltransferase domain-containing protein [Methanomicrobiales archaeon]
MHLIFQKIPGLATRYARKRITRTISERSADGRGVFLNLGCGTRYHKDLINIDTFGNHDIIPWNLAKKLPIPDASVDVIYSSHVLEHLTPDDTRRHLQECHRILKPKGIIRIVVPDLEKIARTYLTCLEAALSEEEGANARYNWIMLELLDQMVRHTSGGHMLAYWSQADVPAEDFIISQVGVEYLRSRSYILEQNSTPKPSPQNPLSVGLFRLCGEVHQWMYDRYSLSRLLMEVGFSKITQVTSTQSSIQAYTSYNLDTEPDGSTYKPDSLYIEALR